MGTGSFVGARNFQLATLIVMGEYLKVGIMLNAVDQQLPAGREPLLPIPAP